MNIDTSKSSNVYNGFSKSAENIGFAAFDYPFYLLQMRRQVNNTTSKLGIGGGYINNYLSMFKQVRSEKVFFKGSSSFILYKGLVGLIWGYSRNERAESTNQQTKVTLATIDFLLSIAFYPMFMVSNLFACDMGSKVESSSKYENKKYNKIRDVFRQVYQNQGLRGLYRGFPLFIISSGIDFIEKELYNHKTDEQSYYALFLLYLAYPFETLRLRLLITPNANSSLIGIVQFAKQTVKAESFKSLFAGCIPQYLFLTGVGGYSYYQRIIKQNDEHRA